MAKMFFCKECVYQSKNETHVKNHVNAVHLKLKPFKCEKCPSVFSQKSSVKNHFKEYHGENAGKIHQCDVCNKTFSTAPHLRRHKSVVHGKDNKRHKCEKCDFKCVETGD